MPSTKENPYLYIFMRNDMKSINGGRCAAQASHATSVFHNFMENNDKNENIKNLYNIWKFSTTQGFGTTVIKAASPEDIDMLHDLSMVEGIYSEVITDPDYVIKDGEQYFSGSVETCLVLFGRELLSDDSQLLKLIDHHSLW